MNNKITVEYIFNRFFGRKNKQNIQIQKEETPRLDVCEIPKKEIETTPSPEIKDEYNNFNEIIVDNNSQENIKYRIQSKASNEIFRIIGVGYEYDQDMLCGCYTKPIQEKIKRTNTYQSFIKKEEIYHFIVRIFKTNNGKYFKQTINNHDQPWYAPLSIQEVQKYVQKCESSNSSDKELWKSNSSAHEGRVILNGTIIKSDTKDEDIKTEYIYDHESIESYEIINKELYDSIIEVY